MLGLCCCSIWLAGKTFLVGEWMACVVTPEHGLHLKCNPSMLSDKQCNSKFSSVVSSEEIYASEVSLQLVDNSGPTGRDYTSNPKSTEQLPSFRLDLK